MGHKIHRAIETAGPMKSSVGMKPDAKQRGTIFAVQSSKLESERQG
jgi:hypothetical protein